MGAHGFINSMVTVRSQGLILVGFNVDAQEIRTRQEKNLLLNSLLKENCIKGGKKNEKNSISVYISAIDHNGVRSIVNECRRRTTRQ
jgi:hypothetical protein